MALRGLALSQKSAGLKVEAVATVRSRADLSIADELASNGIKIHCVGPARGPLLCHPSIPGIVEQSVAASDLVHIHTLWEEIQHQAALCSRVQNKPYLFRPCGMLDPWSLRQSRFKKWLYLRWRLLRDLNRAAAIHYTASEEATLAARLNLKPPEIIEPNGINVDEFSKPLHEQFRARYPQTKNKTILLFMGRLHPKKGLEILLHAFAEIRLPDAMLVLAGPDEAEFGSRLRELTAKLQLQGIVVFTGLLQGNDRIAALQGADLFVLPSFQENFGNVLIESLACGVPVITSDRVNIHREITAAGVGSAVPPEKSALAREMKLWLTQKELRQQAARLARSFAAQFDWPQIAERWTRHYERIIRNFDARERDF